MKIIILSCLLVVSASFRQYGCPGRHLMKPCSCIDKQKGLDISCEGSTIQSIQEAFDNMAHPGLTATYIKLTRNSMDTIPGDFFKGLTVTHVVAHYNNLTWIDEMAFHGLEEKLESLDLSQNLLSKVPTEGLRGLACLVSLNLNYNFLEVLPAFSFVGLVSLLRLSIYGNRIKAIDGRAFFNIGNLTRINLGANRLTSFPTESFSNLTSLQRLQLHDNRISGISRTTFFGMSAADTIDTLNLASNLISEVPANSFFDLKVLNSLDLENNSIRFLHESSFNGLQDTLEWLKLGDNHLSSIPSASLKNLTLLLQLDLRANNISSISKDSFESFGSRLKFLYLQKNKIHSVEVDSFSSLTNLDWLYLHSNSLKSLDESVFHPLLSSSSLSILDVHNNPLECSCDLAWFGSFCKKDSAGIVSQPLETKCLSSKRKGRIPVVEVTNVYPECVTSGSGKVLASMFTLIVLMTTNFLDGRR